MPPNQSFSVAVPLPPVNSTNNQKPGHGIINVICLSEISMMPCPYATTL
ncbi:hypothetical protein [Microseira wollei]|nr:hypothetical protein [Microseira wollei]